MLRIDYVRVPGNIWVENPDERFTTMDLRGPLLTLVYRAVDAVYGDLPKAFKLEEHTIQAKSIGLPVGVIREAVVNAVMHRSYRVHSPIQIVRYDNRIEIINAGYSLKSEEQLGSPGSTTRNPNIAAVFHETNLAETKGTGIRAMRQLLKNAGITAPTFESDRSNNTFTVRLLLHHLLSEKDIEWLSSLDEFNLTDNQKQALVFVREVGAIDNSTYRQLTDLDTLRSSLELRSLRDVELLAQKGKSRATYYVPGLKFPESGSKPSTEPRSASTEPRSASTEPRSASTEPRSASTEPRSASTEPSSTSTGPQPTNYTTTYSQQDLFSHGNSSKLPTQLDALLKQISRRENDSARIERFIIELCKWQPHSRDKIARLLDRNPNYISRKYLKPLIARGELKYKYPDMINHPNQKYKAD